jgi:hypothetical protein
MTTTTTTTHRHSFTLPNGTSATRNSANRIYTHAVLADETRCDGRPTSGAEIYVKSWHGSLEAAEKAASSATSIYAKHGWTGIVFTVVPVTVR